MRTVRVKNNGQLNNMYNYEENLMLVAWMRVRTLNELLTLFIAAKTEGIEEGYEKPGYYLENLEELINLNSLYADTVINNLFKKD